MSRKNELLIQVAERYMYHRDYITDNHFAAETARNMRDIEIDEMWMLTQ